MNDGAEKAFTEGFLCVCGYNLTPKPKRVQATIIRLRIKRAYIFKNARI